MQMLLRDRDALQLVAAQLTREDAGLKLAPLCKAGAAFVRAADAAVDAGQPETWREGPQMWNHARRMSASSAGTHERLERRYAVDGEDVVGLELVLKSLTREIDFLRAAGFVELVFDRAAACAEKQASLLGCHTLRVVDPMEFLTTMQRWTIGVLRQGQFGYAAATVRTFAGSTASHAVINLFTVLGLKRPGRRHSRFQPHPDVERSEPLWQREYVAI